MEAVNIKKELSNDNVYNQMNKEFISLKSPDEKVINEHLELVSTFILLFRYIE